MAEFVKNGMTFKDQQAYITWLEEKNASLEAKNNGAIKFHVTEKNGTVGIYGTNSKGLPVTLYKEQLLRVVEAITGKPLSDDSPLAKWFPKADKYLSLKSDTEEQQKAKHILRQAETQGIVSRPSQAWKDKEAAKEKEKNAAAQSTK